MDRRVDKYPTIQAYAADDSYRGTAVQHAQTQQGRFLEVVVGLTGPYVPMAKR
ncbi:IS5 family transposase domain protein [Candidatus Bealeia paramacronuclearis]|uniref:IS5 family transposase domain protein n=1 Tax=Candidatus Bealeia paramacronuclearis TaxID=1921001 RepID=A0ABZ2C2L2_9PROT|nr:IS5 family transposase domain protein [Candidatus Bealeia paramacronuclearis]